MARKEGANQEQTDLMNEVLITDQAHTDPCEYRLVIEPYRRELLLHCYRLLGSLHEAEDAVQWSEPLRPDSHRSQLLQNIVD